MSHEIRNVIELDGGAYIKIGFRWYRLDAVVDSEHDMAEGIIAECERAALESLGLQPRGEKP